MHVRVLSQRTPNSGALQTQHNTNTTTTTTQQQQPPGAPEEYVDDDGALRALPHYDVSVRPARDLRLMLHRHWTLYDAFRYSPYVAPRMQVRLRFF